MRIIADYRESGSGPGPGRLIFEVSPTLVDGIKGTALESTESGGKSAEESEKEIISDLEESMKIFMHTLSGISVKALKRRDRAKIAKESLNLLALSLATVMKD